MRVSRGMLVGWGSRTKQSSKEGWLAPRVKGVFGEGAEG